MILPIILAGGSGERLWPLSRTAYPKQFLALLGAKHSLFQATIQRLPVNANFLPPLIVCHEEHRFIVAEQLRQIDSPYSAIILEPSANNTAPAIALAACWAQNNIADCTLLILPADHLIQDTDQFEQSIVTAETSVAENLLITFGIPISRPETGYGYIKLGARLENNSAGNYVAQFIEKPDIANATSMQNNPDYLWNSGMFMFSAKTYLNELKLHHPEIVNAAQDAILNCEQDLDFIRPRSEQYEFCTAISIDYALMEHTKHAAVFSLNCSWSDIGNWQSVWEHSNKDEAGNAINGDVICLQTENCLIDARHRTIAAIGIHDLHIIETSDAILIASKDQNQAIKQVVAKLKQRNHLVATEHRQVMRPWGWYDTISKGETFQVKLISVNVGKSLSLQMHKFRSEHWVVVKGLAKVVRGTEAFLLKENESTFIPIGTIHQLSNFGDTTLELIEVQSGSYLGEDDIVRFADEHGRTTTDIKNYVTE